MSTFTANVAASLIRHATGETYGDGEIVTGYGVGYAEPGYHDDQTMWVTGNWNTTQSYANRTAGLPLTPDEQMPAVLADALTRIGVEIEWLDEWTECTDCYRLVRTSGDSYMWQPSFAYVNECEPTCADCLRTMGEDAVTEYVNELRAITWADDAFLTGLGWTRYNADEYESGWHPGQDADPTEITAEIARTLPGHDVVFLLDENSQFYSRFSAYVRPAESEDDNI